MIDDNSEYIDEIEVFITVVFHTSFAVFCLLINYLTEIKHAFNTITCIKEEQVFVIVKKETMFLEEYCRTSL